jgi:hypothetical protein
MTSQENFGTFKVSFNYFKLTVEFSGQRAQAHNPE